MMNLKQYRQGIYLIFLSMTLSSCATISRFIPDFTSANADSSTEVCLDCAQQSGFYCYSNVQDRGWQCQDQADPMSLLSLSDVGLQERSNVIRSMQVTPQKDFLKEPSVEPLFIKPLYAAPEPKINHKSREILNKPPTFFTVQLLALSNEAALHTYARNKHLDDPLYTQINAKGQRLYVLLLGIYSDQVSAKRASQRWLSQGQRSTKPWVRVLGPLQNQIVLASK